MDRRVDLAVALCVVLLGIFVLVSAQGIQTASVPDPIGARGAPTFAGAALCVGGMALALRRLLRWGRERTIVAPEGMEDDAGVEPGSAFRAISIWGASVAYVLVLPLIGYVLATPIFIATVLVLFSIRSWRMIAGVSVGFTVPVFLVFVKLLNVRLPTGVLDGVLRQMDLV